MARDGKLKPTTLEIIHSPRIPLIDKWVRLVSMLISECITCRIQILKIPLNIMNKSSTEQIHPFEFILFHHSVTIFHPQLNIIIMFYITS